MFNTLRCLLTPEKKKISFLEKKVYDYYYTIFINRELSNEQRFNGVSIPDFFIKENAKRLAYDKARKDLEKVIAQKRVNECFRKAI